MGEDSGPRARHHSPFPRRSPSRHASTTRCGSETERRRHGGASRTGLRFRRPDPALERLCLAQPLVGRRPRADLLCRARGSSPGPDRAGGASNRPPIAGGYDRRPLAVEDPQRNRRRRVKGGHAVCLEFPASRASLETRQEEALDGSRGTEEGFAPTTTHQSPSLRSCPLPSGRNNLLIPPTLLQLRRWWRRAIQESGASRQGQPQVPVRMRTKPGPRWCGV